MTLFPSGWHVEASLINSNSIFQQEHSEKSERTQMINTGPKNRLFGDIL